jgi:hypothetical protein
MALKILWKHIPDSHIWITDSFSLQGKINTDIIYNFILALLARTSVNNFNNLHINFTV